MVIDCWNRTGSVFMRLAILLVLILIAVILAPWLLWGIAFLIAAYGLWIVIGAATLVVTGLVFLIVYGLRASLFPKLDSGSRTEQQIAEVNRLYREQEIARRAVATEQEAKRAAELKRVNKAREIACKKCHSSITKHSMYCPKCGNSPL